jgi:hypothetical protein
MDQSNWNLEPDGRHVTLTMPATPPVRATFDTDTVGMILKNLGEFRGQMTPAIQPERWPGGQKADTIPDPAWYVEQDAERGDIVLHIRDPRFGWLHYAIPRATAQQLAVLLQLANGEPGRAARLSGSKQKLTSP